MEVPETYAGQKGRCKFCGHAFVVPQPQGAPPAGVVAPERFGAYSKAADEHWDDPVAQQRHEAPADLGTAAVPPDILEKHRAQKHRQQRRLLLILLGALLLIGLLLGLGYALSGPRQTVGENPAAGAVELPPASPVSASVPPESTPAVEDTGVVYVIAGDTHYHLAQCRLGPVEDSGRRVLTPEQALAAGYTPCRECQPAGHDTFYHKPLYEQINESDRDGEPENESDAPVLTVFVNPGETVVHLAGCPALKPQRQIISIEDAHARGYTLCPRCMPK